MKELAVKLQVVSTMLLKRQKTLSLGTIWGIKLLKQ